jgi:hypothetical protein
LARGTSAGKPTLTPVSALWMGFPVHTGDWLVKIPLVTTIITIWR